MNLIIYAIIPNQDKSLVVQHVSFWPNGEAYEKLLTEEQRLAVAAFEVQVADNSGYWSYATASLEAVVVGNFIHPTGEVTLDYLAVASIGYAGLQESEDFTHVCIMVGEINADGTPTGNAWQSPFYPKDVDYIATLEHVMPLCEGNETTRFNVVYRFVQQQDDGDFAFVSAHIVGDDTSVETFRVSSVYIPMIQVATVDSCVYCLDPVILTVNRREIPNAQYVQVGVGNYLADYEFLEDRNVMEIDIAEYLQTLFALVDLFEFQEMQATVVVKLYNSAWKHLQTQGRTITAVYGMKPESEIPDNLRVQWLDKFGALHDVMFKVFQNVAEGDSKQKYVSKGIEHEEKTGERSLSLAYVNANASQRIALETIVFADHVRAYMGGTWKRVKVANTYKNGTGREKRNFEITIKYAL